MNNVVKIVALSSLLVPFFFSCSKDKPVVFDQQNGYFGLIPGRYVDYNVMEISHAADQSNPHDTLRYQLRTVIGDTITDNEGRVARKYFRFKRNDDSDNWIQTDVWTAIIVDRRAELIEENQRMIKLVFEPTESKEWNLNAFNMNGELMAYYRDIHKSKQIGMMTFDSTLVVEQEDFLSLIDYRRKYEVYAKNVGLIRKYFKDLKINGFDTLKVNSGTELFYECIGFGYQ
jgi:hypothetical protein